MKHSLSQKLLLIAALLICSPAFAYYNFEVDGIYYYYVSQDDKTIGVGYDAASSNYYSGDIVIPETVSYNGEVYTITSIGSSAFKNCRDMNSILMPNTITTIGNDAFNSCTGLTSITIPNATTTIGEYAFSSCSNLQSPIIIPNNVTTIGKYAFSYCYNISSITIPSSVTSIGNKAFYSCNALEKVFITDLEAWLKINFETYSANPVYFSKKIYLNDKLLTQLEIPNTITEISDFAFYNCTELSSVKIPSSVTSIGDNAFGYCSNITKVVCESTTPPTIESQTFYNVSTSATLYIPTGSKNAYATAEYWKEFANIEESDFFNETTITIKDASNHGAVSIKTFIGTDFEFTVTPATGYVVNTVLVNDDEISASDIGAYVVESVGGDIIISVSYELDPASGVNSLNTNNIKVYGCDNILTIIGTEYGDDISLYELNGTLLHTQNSAGLINNIQLNGNGVYIVKINNKTFKVML